MSYFEKYFKLMLFKDEKPFVIFKKNIHINNLLNLEILPTYVKIEYIEGGKTINKILKYKDKKIYNTLKFHKSFMIITEKTSKETIELNKKNGLEKSNNIIKENLTEEEFLKKVKKEVKKDFEFTEEITYKLYTFD